MSYFTRKNIITALIIILLVINVAALLTFIFRPHMFKPGREKNCGAMQCPASFMKEELKLSDEQFIIFDEFRKEHMDTINRISARMKEKRKFINAEMMKAAPDTALLKSVSEEVGRDYAAIRMLNVYHYWKVKTVCNDEQKRKLDTVFKGIFYCGERNMGGCGKGPDREGCRKTKYESGGITGCEGRNNIF
jgi:hypothetical protein